MKQYKSQILLLLVAIVVLIAGILQLYDKAYAVPLCSACKCAPNPCQTNNTPCVIICSWGEVPSNCLAVCCYGTNPCDEWLPPPQ